MRVKYRVEVGMVFSRLTVLDLECPRRYTLCQCVCGTVKRINTSCLVIGEIRSCGCLNREVARNKALHGKKPKRVYSIWARMKSRCDTVNGDDYADYGGRGITYCAEWADFVPFRDWALSNGYAEHLTIERKDVNGNYCPENCRWATTKEQARNKRNSRTVTLFGVTKCLADWQDDPRCAISQRVLSSRLRAGWCVEQALTTPVKVYAR